MSRYCRCKLISRGLPVGDALAVDPVATTTSVEPLTSDSGSVEPLTSESGGGARAVASEARVEAFEYFIS